MKKTMDLHPILRALADRTRLKLIERLRHGGGTIRELAEDLGLKQSMLSNHLRVLLKAGVVVRRHPRPRRAEHHLAPRVLVPLREWLEELGSDAAPAAADSQPPPPAAQRRDPARRDEERREDWRCW